MIDLSIETALSIRQAADRCGVSTKTIREWFRPRGHGRKRLRHGKLGGKVITSVEALNEFQVGGDDAGGRAVVVDRPAHRPVRRVVRSNRASIDRLRTEFGLKF